VLVRTLAPYARPRTVAGRRVETVTAIALLLGTCLVPAAWAQDAGSPNKKAPTVEELQKRLDERDAVIQELLLRVVKLEHAVAAQQAPSNTKTATAPAAVAPIPPRPAQPAGQAPTSQAPASQTPATQTTTTQTTVAQAPAATPPAAPAGEAQAAAPGTFEVDAEAAEHALERALVQTGAALLQNGQYQIVPSFTYTRREATVPGQLALTTNGRAITTDILTTQDQYEGAVLFRAGLPWEMQLDLSVPYDYLDTSNTTRAFGVGFAERATSSWLLGEPSITLDKELVHEGEWIPNLIASVGWLSDVGRSHNSPAIGGGFNEVSLGLSAFKRQDPLVFTSAFRYTHSFAEGGITPGDTYTAATAVLFAVSPETSLTFGPQLSFTNKTEAGGTRTPGSEAAAALFQGGVFTNLGPGVALDFTSGIGAGLRAPRYVFQLALPIQF